MNITSVQLKNFRNITFCELQPSEGINFFVGQNAQGKTSLLEALVYLSYLKSFRNSKLEEVIQKNSKKAQIICELKKEKKNEAENINSYRTKLSCQIEMNETGQAKRFFMANDKPIKSSLKFLEERQNYPEKGFYAVVFHPGDHDLIRSVPSFRRGYFDRILGTQSEFYLNALKSYQKALQQRNAILKNFIFSRSTSLLEDFSEQLAIYGTKMLLYRRQWMEKFIPHVNRIICSITSEAFSLTIEEENKIGDQSSCPQVIHNKIKEILLKNKEKDRSVGWTTGGPHRSDWSFQLNERSLKGYGSQGEIRATLLALKLAEIELYQKDFSDNPVLFLDDFSSELDQKKREYLLDYIADKKLQAFITTTEFKPIKGQQYWVKNGHFEMKESSVSKIEKTNKFKETAFF